MTSINRSKNKIIVTGYALVPPPSLVASAKGIGANFGLVAEPLERRLKRFSAPAGEQAFTASRHVFEMAGVEPENVGESFGLYTNQAGSADIENYRDGLDQWLLSGDPILENLWQSKFVNPFLAIRSLSNNLLGLMSVLWSFRGDCCAFIRDQVGAASALDEAIFNLQQNYIDTALVLTAGTNLDHFEAKFKGFDKHFEPECGAVALLLKRQDDNELSAIAELSDMTHGYQFNSDTAHLPERKCAQSLKLPQIMENKYYYNSQEPRWGGIVYSLVQIIHSLKEQQKKEIIRIDSIDPNGFHASVKVNIAQGSCHE